MAIGEEKLIYEKFTKTYPFLGSDAIEKIAQLGKIVSIAKKDHFIKVGITDKRLAFVTEGLFRGYVNNEGEETTLWFSTELDILASYSGILLNEGSKITYQALEDSTLFVINYGDLKSLAKTDHSIAFIIIEMLEQILGEAYQRNERFILMDAETRYLDLIERKPGIISSVPQKLLASYIGVTPVSLSRLRARLQKKEAQNKS